LDAVKPWDGVKFAVKKAEIFAIGATIDRTVSGAG
jgi:hypothetical protein